MLKDAGCIVFKVGTSTLMHPTKKTNIHVVDCLAQVLSDLANAGKRVVLVTSGAIGFGVEKLGLPQRPRDTAGKQAAATVGQCALMYLYDKMFAQYGRSVGQLLMTKDDVEHANRRQNLVNAFQRLFDFGVIPIVNENDAVAVEEIVYGDNDSLSAVVATLVEADALVILTETDGLYDKNPTNFPDAKRIPVVERVTDEIRALAGGSGSSVGTGGMITKVHAAEMAAQSGIPTYIINGSNPKMIYSLMEGADIGTHFLAGKETE
ncbi:MAG TPA: glutamate 5-kinase [Candidatus Aphodomonas merdavium]|nr:glutamate 5-kinase [Candidatus Aphodomonas merdavium]